MLHERSVIKYLNRNFNSEKQAQRREYKIYGKTIVPGEREAVVAVNFGRNWNCCSPGMEKRQAQNRFLSFSATLANSSLTTRPALNWASVQLILMPKKAFGNLMIALPYQIILKSMTFLSRCIYDQGARILFTVPWFSEPKMFKFHIKY